MLTERGVGPVAGGFGVPAAAETAVLGSLDAPGGALPGGAALARFDSGAGDDLLPAKEASFAAVVERDRVADGKEDLVSFEAAGVVGGGRTLLAVRGGVLASEASLDFGFRPINAEYFLDKLVIAAG